MGNGGGGREAGALVRSLHSQDRCSRGPNHALTASGLSPVPSVTLLLCRPTSFLPPSSSSCSCSSSCASCCCSSSPQAKAKFQEIQKAYEALMSTSEDDIIEQLPDRAGAGAVPEGGVVVPPPAPA